MCRVNGLDRLTSRVVGPEKHVIDGSYASAKHLEKLDLEICIELNA